MMKNTSEQITKLLGGLVSEESKTEVEKTVSTFLEDAIKELDTEYDGKLKEAFEEHQKELTEERKVAEEGYGQALEIIQEFRERLEVQKEEFEQALEEGYEEAYQMLQEERAKNDTLEVDLYEEYDRKFSDIKEYLVDKLDQFLQLQGQKYYETAKRDVLNDPAVVEHKLAFEDVLNIASKYLSDEDYAFATNGKVETLQKELHETKGQMKILESKNMRLSMDNTKLNESTRQAQELLNEHATKGDRKARSERARQVEGRGDAEPDRQRQRVIAETREPVQNKAPADDTSRFAEQVGEEVFADWKHLSGLTKDE
jgi:hypothetical protein